MLRRHRPKPHAATVSTWLRKRPQPPPPRAPTEAKRGKPGRKRRKTGQRRRRDSTQASAKNPSHRPAILLSQQAQIPCSRPPRSACRSAASLRLPRRTGKITDMTSTGLHFALPMSNRRWFRQVPKGLRDLSTKDRGYSHVLFGVYEVYDGRSCTGGSLGLIGAVLACLFISIMYTPCGQCFPRLSFIHHSSR